MSSERETIQKFQALINEKFANNPKDAIKALDNFRNFLIDQKIIPQIKGNAKLISTLYSIMSEFVNKIDETQFPEDEEEEEDLDIETMSESESEPEVEKEEAPSEPEFEHIVDRPQQPEEEPMSESEGESEAELEEEMQEVDEEMKEEQQEQKQELQELEDEIMEEVPEPSQPIAPIVVATTAAKIISKKPPSPKKKVKEYEPSEQIVRVLEGKDSSFDNGLDMTSEEFDVTHVGLTQPEEDYFAVEVQPVIAPAAQEQVEMQIDATSVQNPSNVLTLLANFVQFPLTIIEDPQLISINNLYNIDPFFQQFFMQLTALEKLQFLKHANVTQLFEECMKNYQEGSCMPVHCDVDFDTIIQSFQPEPATQQQLLDDILASGNFYATNEEDIATNVQNFVTNKKFAQAISQEQLQQLTRQIEKKIEDIQRSQADEQDIERDVIAEGIFETQKEALDRLYAQLFPHKEDESLIDETKLSEALLTIQRVNATPVEPSSGASYKSIASLVCPKGYSDLERMQELYNDSEVVEEVLKFKQANGNKSIEDIHQAAESGANLSNKTRQFLILFLSYYEDLSELPSNLSVPTFTRLTKLEDFPHLFQTPIQAYIEKENQAIQDMNREAINSCDGYKPFLKLNEYVAALSDNKVSGKERSELKDELTNMINSMKLSSFIDVDQLKAEFEYGKIEPLFQEMRKHFGKSKQFPSEQQLFQELQDPRSQKQKLNSVIKKLKEISKSENERLINALNDNVLSALYRAFYAYRDVRIKRTVDPFHPTYSIERRQKRRAAAQIPWKIIQSKLPASATPQDECMHYLQTKPWLNVSSDFVWYLRGSKGDLAASRSFANKQFLGPSILLPQIPSSVQLYEPSMQFWQWYCNHFGPNVLQDSKWNADCSLASVYDQLLKGEMRLGLVNLLTGQMIDMNEKHYKQECEYMKLQTMHTLNIVVHKNDTSTLIERIMIKQLHKSLDTFKRKKKLVMDVVSESKKMAKHLMQTAIHEHWSYKRLLSVFYLIETLLVLPGANFFQTLVALDAKFRSQEIHETSIERMLPELHLLHRSYQNAKSVMDLPLVKAIQHLISLKALQLASDVGIISNKRANYEAGILDLQQKLPRFSVTMRRNEFKNLCYNKDQVSGDVIMYFTNESDPNKIFCLGFEQIHQISAKKKTFDLATKDLETIQRLFGPKDDFKAQINEMMTLLTSAIPSPLTSDHYLLVQESMQLVNPTQASEEPPLELIKLFQQAIPQHKTYPEAFQELAIKRLASLIVEKVWNNFEDAYQAIQSDPEWKAIKEQLLKVGKQVASTHGQQVMLNHEDQVSLENGRLTDVDASRRLIKAYERQLQQSRLDREPFETILANGPFLTMLRKLMKDTNDENEHSFVDLMLPNIVDRIRLELHIPELILPSSDAATMRVYALMEKCQACKKNLFDFESVVSTPDGFERIRVCKQLGCFRKLLSETQLSEVEEADIRKGEIQANAEQLIMPYTTENPDINERLSRLQANPNAWHSLLDRAIKEKKPELAFDENVLYDRADAVYQLFKRLILDGQDASSQDRLDREYNSPMKQLQLIFKNANNQLAQAIVLDLPKQLGLIPTAASEIVAEQNLPGCPEVKSQEVYDWLLEYLKAKKLIGATYTGLPISITQVFKQIMSELMIAFPVCQEKLNQDKIQFLEDGKIAYNALNFLGLAAKTEEWKQYLLETVDIYESQPEITPEMMDQGLKKVIALYLAGNIDILTTPLDQQNVRLYIDHIVQRSWNLEMYMPRAEEIFDFLLGYRPYPLMKSGPTAPVELWNNPNANEDSSQTSYANVKATLQTLLDRQQQSISNPQMALTSQELSFVQKNNFMLNVKLRMIESLPLIFYQVLQQPLDAPIQLDYMKNYYLTTKKVSLAELIVPQIGAFDMKLTEIYDIAVTIKNMLKQIWSNSVQTESLAMKLDAEEKLSDYR